MNVGIFIAALAFIMLLLGGLPLLLLGIVLFAAWFAWQVFFYKEPDDNPNGYCRELHRETVAEAEQNKSATH